MADDLIRYDLLVQDALRGVVRKVLTDAAREGLAGEHHFYVSFRTEAPGVRMSQRLREKYPNLENPPSDDICYATQNRQLAVKEMAPQCDLMIVVGSRNSSNSVRLVEVALDHGARAGHLVDYADEIDEAWLDGVSTVGVTSGASVPEILVREVLAFLADRGFGEPETVVAAEESLTFALPNEIRRDLKAAGMSDKMTHDAAAATDGVTDPLH